MRNTPAHYDIAGSPDGCGGVDDPPRLRTLRRCGAARPFTRVRDRAAPARIVERLDRWSTRGIAIDLPAHGESDGVPAPFHELAARLHDRLGSLAVDRPIMVGHSMSGGLASFYASTYPTRGLVVIDNGPEIRPFARLLQSRLRRLAVQIRLAVVRVSLQLLPEQPASELLDAIVAADERGYYACYSADEIYHKDPWLLFAAAARRTERIRFGPCVAPMFMREPTYVAQLAATLDELSDGRAEVVFGIGNIAMLEQYGVEWRGTRPMARLREAHHVMRTVLDEGAIDFAGDFYGYRGVTTASRPVQEHLPLKIGAMGGPRSMELAGEVADGLHTACAYSSEALAYAADRFRAGAERARRDADDLDLGDSLLGAVAADGEIARRAGRILAAFYIPSMPPALLERHAIAPDEMTAINEAFAAGDVRAALEATPDDVADRIMVAGTPEDWVRWLTETYAPAGLNHALVSFTDPFTLRAWAGIEVEGLPDLGAQVRLFGEQVLPAIATL